MNRSNNFHIGMRIWKTVIAVAICAFTGYMLDMQPFYSIIAAILCMQSNTDESLQKGISRCIGTFIGGGFACVILLFVDFTPLEPFSFIYYIIICLFVVPLIFTAVRINYESSAYITCVVFFSIVLSHIDDDNTYLFALKRVCETIFGIVVSLGINRLIKNPDNAKTK